MQIPKNALLAWLAFSSPFIAAPAASGNAPASQRRAYHLLVATNEEAAKIREVISARGGDRKAFREAVRKHSKDTTTKPLGGDLGWMGKLEKFDPAFLEAAFALKIGTVSQPVETKYGWHLIFIEMEGIGKAEQIPDDPDSKIDEAAEGPARAEAIVKRYLKVIGGVEALDAIADRTTRFKNVKSTENAAKTTARIALFLKRGHKYREEWLIEGFGAGNQELSFNQGYDGDDGWVQMFGTLSPLDGRTLQVFVWDKHIDDFFRHWEEDGYRLTHEGSGKVEEEVVEIVATRDFTGQSFTRYFFSKANGLLLKKEWQDTDAKDRKTSTKEQYYRNYEKVPFSDDSNRFIRFPRHHEVRVNGKPDTDRIFEEVSFNTGLDDKLFERPEGKPFAVPAGKRQPEDG